MKLASARNLLLRERSPRHGLSDGEVARQMLYNVRLGLDSHLIGVETGHVCHDLHSDLKTGISSPFTAPRKSACPLN
jgi:hypothetical protein